MYDKGAMDTNHDFIDGVLKANRSKCSGSAGYFFGFAQQMKPFSGPPGRWSALLRHPSIMDGRINHCN